VRELRPARRGRSLAAPRKSFDRASSLSARQSIDGLGGRAADLAFRLPEARRANGSAGPLAHTEQDVHLCPPTPKVAAPAAHARCHGFSVQRRATRGEPCGAAASPNAPAREPWRSVSGRAVRRADKR